MSNSWRTGDVSRRVKFNPATHVADSPKKQQNQRPATCPAPRSSRRRTSESAHHNSASIGDSVANADFDSGRIPHRPSRRSRCFVISVVGLFLELLLIRWISTEIRIFAYLQNTVLVVCFLGPGDGLLGQQPQVRAARHAAAPRCTRHAHGDPADAAVLAGISALFGGFSDLLVWGSFWSDGPRLYSQVASVCS